MSASSITQNKKCMCKSVCPKNSSQTVNGSDLKFAHVILWAILRSTLLFSIFKFSNIHLFLNRIPVLNSRATESSVFMFNVVMFEGSTDQSRVAGVLITPFLEFMHKYNVVYDFRSRFKKASKKVDGSFHRFDAVWCCATTFVTAKLKIPRAIYLLMFENLIFK